MSDEQKTANLESENAWKRCALMVVYACAMGLLEAICVIYLRRLIWPDGLTPGHPPLRLGRHIELIREASTIIMLVTVAWLAGRNVRARVAAFFVMFGFWDILYYVGLWQLAGWPSSLLTWDCLFLIPEPWYGPVLAPVLISAVLIVGCGRAFLLEESGYRVSPTLIAWSLLAAGMVIWYWSFVKDVATIKAHGYSGVTYSWPLFAWGLMCCVSGFVWTLVRSRRAAIRPFTRETDCVPE